MAAATPATEVSGKEVVSRLLEAWGGGQLALVDDLVATNYVGTVPGHPTLKGRGELKAYLETFREGFPDLNVTIQRQLAERDRVVTEFKLAGVHRGTFEGVPGTKKSIDLWASVFTRMRSGAVAEQWYEWDRLALYQQLEIMPRL